MGTPAVEFSDYTFRYASRREPTLFDISLTVQPGTKILIAGLSGSGKSTIGCCINGLVPHSLKGEGSGTIRVKGLDPAEAGLHQLSKSVGTILQDTDGQFVGLSVGEDIAFALENDAKPPDEMRKNVLRAASLVGMDSHLNQSPFSLSGGQKQRVSLAGILVDAVDILLFDEPLANLDPATAKRAIEIIDEIHQETGKTVIIIEHRLEDVLHRDVDSVVLMKNGRIVSDSTPDELLSSGRLVEYGIREPLYLSAIRMAGVRLSSEDAPRSLKLIPPVQYADAVRSWFQGRPESSPREERPVLMEAKNVACTYDGETPILKEIDFLIHEGESLALLGENGAGKSTFAKVLTGIVRPEKGTLLWKGEDVTEESISSRSGRIGFVMQNPNHMISQHMIRDEVGFGLRLKNLEESEITEQVDAVLQTCGLYPFRNWPVSNLSYGQKKRVTIASILVLNPRMLILDEPTAGQDYRHYTEFMRFIDEIRHKFGQSVLLVTHDLHLALEYTDRAVVLSQGEIIADGPVSRVFSNSSCLEQAGLRTTSLYDLAVALNIEPADDFIEWFIRTERASRHG